MSTVTIWHNPRCGTSRNTLALIRATGAEPQVVEYLEQPPSRAELEAMIAGAGLTARQAMRSAGTPAAELGLEDPDVPNSAIIDAMLAHPILINRPFVRSPLGARLCRPSEKVLEILPGSLPEDFVKEDGEIVSAPRG